MIVPGSKTRAQAWHKLFMSFSDAMSLFCRAEPLCEHQIKDLPARTDRYACEYARTMRKAPPLKTHLICAEMALQARRKGRVGIFTESVVESCHVKDNQYKRRCATTTSICDNMRLRCQCHWRNTSGYALWEHYPVD
jgi:hypothetical protein